MDPIVWITGFMGEGKLWVDFYCYPVRPHMMCFISPGQIRAWDTPALQTPGAATGYAIDFTQGFFSNSPDDPNALGQLPYFHGVGAAPVLYVNEEQARLFTEVCSRLEREMQLALDGQSTLKLFTSGPSGRYFPVRVQVSGGPLCLERSWEVPRVLLQRQSLRSHPGWGRWRSGRR